MSDSQKTINQIVSEIIELSDSAFSMSSGFGSLGVGSKPFRHNWRVESDNKFPSEYWVELSDINDAVEVIHLFSEEPHNEIIKGLKSFNAYAEKPPVYLHYYRTLIQ